MRSALARFPAGFSGPDAITSEEMGRLAALGYLGGATTDEGPLPNPRDHIQVLDQVHAAFRLSAEGRDAESVACSAHPGERAAVLRRALPARARAPPAGPRRGGVRRLPARHGGLAGDGAGARRAARPGLPRPRSPGRGEDERRGRHGHEPRRRPRDPGPRRARARRPRDGRRPPAEGHGRLGGGDERAPAARGDRDPARAAGRGARRSSTPPSG